MKRYRYLCFFAAVLLCISCIHTRAVQYPNMIANVEPFTVGSLNASTDQSFSSKIRTTEVEVIFHPRTNEVELAFKFGVSPYRQFWSEAGRKLFIEALSSYKEDFANQRLNTRYTSTRAAYGKFDTRFEWKTFAYSDTYKASPVIELGYRFRENSPYLAASQRTAKEETGNNEDGITESPPFGLYFTRAQGDELARLFDQAYLLRLLGEDPAPPITDSGRDVYIEK